MACVMCLSLSGVYAQVQTNNVKVQVTDTKQNSGFDFSYLAVDDGWGLGGDLLMGHFALGFKYIGGEENDYMKSNTSWILSAGYNHRFWLGEFFYIDARAGLQYMKSSYEMYAGTKTITNTIGYGSNRKEYSYTVEVWEDGGDDGFGLYFTPRVGLALGKSFAISAGYEWNFADFKFDKEHRIDYFTIGMSLIF